MKCRYIVSWTSAVTGNKRDSGYATKAHADKDAANLIKEGAKDVKVYEFKPED